MKRMAAFLIFLISFQFYSLSQANPPTDWQITSLYGGRSKAEVNKECLLAGRYLLNLTDNGIYSKRANTDEEWNKFIDNTESVLGDMYLDIACKGVDVFVVGSKGVGKIVFDLDGAYIEPIAAPSVGPFTPTLNSIAINGDSIIVSVQGSDITFYSLDCGETWNEHNPRIPGGFKIEYSEKTNQWITTPDEIIVSPHGIRMSNSVNGEFKPADEGLPNGGSSIRDFALSANYAYTLDDPGKEIYRARLVDSLVKWSVKISEYAQNLPIGFEPTDISAGTYNPPPPRLPGDTSVSYLYTWNESEIYRSDDEGFTWNALNNLDNIKVNDIKEQNGEVFASTNEGLYRIDTLEQSENWVWDMQGVTAANVNNIVIDDTLAYLYAGTETGYLYRTRNGGELWEKFGRFYFPVSSINLGPFGRIYVNTVDGGIFRSDISEPNWEKIGEGLPAPDNLENLTVDSEGNIYVSIYLSGLYKSEDQGDSWNLIKPGSPQYVGFGQDDNLYVFQSDTLFQSSDQGQNWNFRAKYTGPCCFNMSDLAVLQNDEIYLGTAEAFGSNIAGMYRVAGDTLAQINSENDGLEKVSQAIDPDFKFIPFPKILPVGDSIVLALSGSGNAPTSRIYVSYDIGQNWKRLADVDVFNERRLNDFVAYADGSDSIRIFVAPMNGSVIRNWPFPGSSTDIQPVIHKENFSWMEKPYPNPANSTVNIVLNVPEEENINLEIYDLQGRQVEIIYNGRMDRGRREFLWERSGISSGVYILRLKAGARLESQRIYLFPE